MTNPTSAIPRPGHVDAQGRFWYGCTTEPVDSKPTPATVAVPVTMIEAAADQIPGSALASQFRDLLPKPTPRLVAVDIAGFDDEGVFGVRYLKTQPDLLSVLDKMFDSVAQTWALQGLANPGKLSIVLKKRARRVLGVTE